MRINSPIYILGPGGLADPLSACLPKQGPLTTSWDVERHSRIIRVR